MSSLLNQSTHNNRLADRNDLPSQRPVATVFLTRGSKRSVQFATALKRPSGIL